MAAVCPNKNTPEWKSLVNEVGEFEAYRDFLEYNGDIRGARVVRKKLAVRARNIPERLQKERTTSAGVPVALDILENLAKDLAAKFGDEYAYRVEPYPNKPWKGKVEAASVENGGKRTIVINSAKATLDTPLHEFGHILLDMIKNENQVLYAELRRTIPLTKEGRAELAQVRKYYPELKEGEDIDETIVELMGRHAADLISTKSKLYTLLESIWNSIKKHIAKIISEGTGHTVQTVDLEKDTTIAVLAELLTIKNLKFTAGTQVKEKLSEIAAKNNKQIQEMENQLTIMNSLDVDNPETSNDPEALVSYYSDYRIHAISRKSLDAISDIGKVWPIIKKYLSATSDPSQFHQDTIKLTNKMMEMGASLTPEEKLTTLRLNDEFDNWFMVFNSFKNETKESFIKDLKDDPKALWPAGKFISSVKKQTDNYSQQTTIAAITSSLRNDERFITKLFPNVHSTYSIEEQLNEKTIADISAVLEYNIEDLKINISKPIRAKGEFVMNIDNVGRGFEGDFKDETITVNIDYKTDGSLYVGFKSSEWLYGDPVWVVDFDKDKAKVGDRVMLKQPPGVAAVQKRHKIYNQPFGQIEDILEDGTVIMELLNINDPYTILDTYLKDDYQIIGDQTSGVIAISPDLLNSVVTQSGRAARVMRQVLKEVSRYGYNFNYTAITFAASESDWGNESMMRQAIYQGMAQRMFGKDFALVSHNVAIKSHAELEAEARDKWIAEGKDPEKFSMKTIAGLIKRGEITNINYDLDTIVIPQSYRDGLFVQKDVYQKERIDSSVPEDAVDSLAGLSTAQNPIKEKPLSPEENNKIRAVEIAKKLSNQLDVDYQMVTSDEAMAITANAENPWNGQPAFFFGGIVYFVGDKLDTDLVLHEFAHPLLRQIKVTNKELFDNLYMQLSQTSEGQKIIKMVSEKYPNLTEDMAKEEVLAQALGEAGAQQLDGLKPQSKFAAFIKELMYQIKQLLRGNFGQNIKISKLNPSTSMNSLAEILMKGGNFDIQTDQISQEDVVAYQQEQTQYIDDLINVDTGGIQAMLNNAHNASSHQLETLIKQKKWAELADLLTDEYGYGDLQRIKKETGAFQNALLNAAKEAKNSSEHLRNQAGALVNVIFRLEKIMDKINRHVKDLMTDEETDSLENLTKLTYYDSIVSYWAQFVEEAKGEINKNDIPHDSAIVQSINGISTLTDRFHIMRDEIFAIGARDTLYNELEPMGRDLKKRYESIIAKLKERKAPQKQIDKWHMEYYGMTEEEFIILDRLRKEKRAGKLRLSEQSKYDALMLKNAQGIEISPEKIEGLLKGQMGDANFFNSYLEGYLYNTDPVIGGLALYVKNHLNQVMVTAQAKFQDFKKDIWPLMDAIGVNPHNIGKFGEMMGFEDSVGKFNRETGEIEDRKVWTLLNKFKDYRLDLARVRDAVDRAETDYQTSGSDKDKRVLIAAVNTRKQLLRDYFHQEYTDKFYNRDQGLVRNDQDTIGQDATYLRDNIYERMNALTDNAKTESDNLALTSQMDNLWSEYHQLHSLYTLDGKPKNARDTEIAKRLRAYRKESKQYYEWKLRKGVFENALARYEQELREAGVIDKDIFDTARAEWIHKNTRSVIKQEWYDHRADLLKKIDKINSKLYKHLTAAEIKAINQNVDYEKIMDLTSPFKDDNKQTRANEMSIESLAAVKASEEAIAKKKKNYITRSGLTPIQSARLSELHKIDKKKRTVSQNQEMADIYADKKKFGLSEGEILALDAYYAELASLSNRDASEYYVEVMNGWLSMLDTTYLYDQYETNDITSESANSILEPRILQSLMGQNEEFDKWFKANHIFKEFFDKTATPPAMSGAWERTRAWSIVRPSDPAHYESIEVVNSEGEVETIPGLPKLSYYARVVRPEFRTERIVGETVDNQGQWLPKTIEQKAKDGKYRNQAYYDMAENEPGQFKALMMLTKHHLANQEGLSWKNRLYLDFPRFRKSNLETVQRGNPITIWANRAKDFFRKTRDDAEDGFNYDEDEANLVRADIFDNEVTGVPIAGLYDIENNDVSTDITYTMMRYMLSAERQKQLVAISPVARAIQKVVNDPKHEVKDLTKKHRFNLVHKGITTYLNKKGMKVRASAVNNFMEREFEGQNMKGIETPWLNNAANKMFGRASFGFFALNIPSALKNSFGAKFQGMIEAAAGKYMNARSFAAGDILAGKVMMETSNQIYRRTPKSLHMQMTEVFDFSQGRFEDPTKFGTDLSRTITQDIASFSWLYNFRKWVELQATYQIGFGMLKYQKIEMEDGTIINYDQAWEVVDGKIQLKEGVPAEWGITYNEEGEIQIGKEFMRWKNKMQQVMNNLQGAYSKFDQPEAQRYLAFRFLSYLRRYFTTMTMNRWGYSGKFWNAKPRLNPGLGDTQKGFYVEFLNTFKNTITSLGGNLQYMTKEEKRAAIKVITEVGSLILLNFLMGALFGWDGDDEDRFKKLREKSASLPFPFVSDQKGREFDGWGFLENHVLLLFMNIQAENEQFLPLPGIGLDDYTAMLDLKSIAFGPTVKTYRQIVDDLLDIAQGDDSAYYKRDVGPYNWQRKGGAKIWSHIARTVGLTGSSIAPEKAIKGLQTSKAAGRAG